MNNKKNFDIGKVDSNMAIKQPDENGLIWFAPNEQPFRITGFHWFTNDKVYRRFPLNPIPALPAGVEGLSWNTAGGQVSFKSDCTRLCVKCQLRHPSGMYHMPQTGQSGFDLYIGKPGKAEFYGISRYNYGETEFTCELFAVKTHITRCFTINFPLYNGVNELLIGVDADCRLEPSPPYHSEHPIVVYGTSITQGGCASKPGACYTNILSRKFNRPFINLGFSGSGRGEPEVAEHISRIAEPAMIILDYEANSYKAPKSLADSLPEFIRIIRNKHQSVPILVVSAIKFVREKYLEHLEVEPAMLSRQQNSRKIAKKIVADGRAAGDNNLHFLDGSTLLGDDYYECTVDGVHPTDMGFYRMAKAMAPVIDRILTPGPK